MRLKKKMVTQPSNAQGIQFNIQYYTCILEPGNDRGSRIHYHTGSIKTVK